MRVVLFLNGWVGWKIATWLTAQQTDIAAVVLHPTDKRKFGQEILDALGIEEQNVIDGSMLRDFHTIATLGSLKADMGISAFFGYLLPTTCIDLFPGGCINIHPAYLPFNRGSYPNVWSIVDGTPAGATIHFMDTGIDTGDILAQKQVPVVPMDTGATLYQKLDRACVLLFQETWPRLLAGTTPRTPQRKEKGTSHRVKDTETIDEIDLHATYMARTLIDRMRARTFPHYPGTFFRCGTKKVYMRLQFLTEEEVGSSSDPPLRYDD